MAVDGQATAALEHGAEARLAEGRVADTPAASPADLSREHGSRLQQRHDFGERVVHVWTITNEIRTLHRRESGARAIRYHHEDRADYGVLVRLRPGNRSTLSRARLDRDRHHAPSTRRPAGSIRQTPHRLTRR